MFSQTTEVLLDYSVSRTDLEKMKSDGVILSYRIDGAKVYVTKYVANQNDRIYPENSRPTSFKNMLDGINFDFFKSFLTMFKNTSTRSRNSFGNILPSLDTLMEGRYILVGLLALFLLVVFWKYIIWSIIIILLVVFLKSVID